MDAEYQQIAQRQALAQALLQRGLSGGPQGQMVSGHYVAPGLLASLLPVAQAAIGSKMGQEAAGAATAYEGRQRAALGAELGKFMNTLRGSEGTPMGPPTEGGEMGGPTGAVQADPQAAMLQAITSKHPEMQKIGQSQLATMFGPKKPESFGHTPVNMMIDGKLTPVLVGDAGTVRPIAGMTPATKMEATPDGQLYDPYSGATGPYVGDRYGPPQNVNGEVVQFSGRSNKPIQTANRPPQTKVSVTATGSAGEDAYLKERGKGVAAAATKLQDSAQAATGILRSVAQLRELDRAGTFTGPTASAATFFSQLAQTLGLPVDSKLTPNSEAYRAEVRNLLIAQMQQLGGAKGLSEKETQLVLEAFPNLDRSPQARATIFNILERKSQQAQAEYQNLLREERRRYPTQGMMGYDFSEVGAGGTAPGAPPVIPPAPATGQPTIKRSGW